MFNKKIFVFLVCTVLIFLASPYIFAQEAMLMASAPKRELMMFEEIPVVVSASKHAQSLVKAPAAISVISSEDIENMDYTHLWDLFRRVPGVDVSTLDGRAGSVAPRGFMERFTRRNQLLIDGRSSYSPLFGGTEWEFLPIMPEDIERIEVIRGPNATLYGANAFTGVINIITKEAKDTKGVMAKETYGTADYERVFTRYGGTMGKMDYRFSYAYQFDYGYGADNGRTVNDKTRAHTMDWRSKYNLSENSNLELILGEKLDLGRPDSVTANSSNTSSNASSNFQMIKYNTKIFGDQDFTMHFFRNDIDENRHGAGYLYPYLDVQTTQYDFEFQHNFNWLSDKMNTVWGGNSRYNAGKMNLFDGNAVTNTTAEDTVGDHIYRLFFNNDYKINDKWDFIFGLMGENNRYTNYSYSPRYSILFSPTENRMFRFTYARAFRTPTMLEDTQNFTITDNAFVRVKTLGNEDLKNEVIDSYELGYTSYLLDNKLNLGVQPFYNKYRDLFHVYSVSTGAFPTVTTASFDNRDYGQARGIELEANYAPLSWLKVYGNSTMQKYKDTLGVFKNSVPEFKFNFGARFLLDKQKMTFNIDNYFTSSHISRDFENTTDTGIKIKPYLRTDFRIAKTFFDGNLEWAIKGENLLHQSHIEARSGADSTTQVAVEVNRTFYTTLTAKF